MRVIFTVLNRPALRNGSSAEKFSAAWRFGTLMMNTLPVRVAPSSASVPPASTTMSLWRSREAGSAARGAARNGAASPAGGGFVLQMEEKLLLLSKHHLPTDPVIAMLGTYVTQRGAR